MQILQRENTEQKKATLTQADYVTNPFDAGNFSNHNIWGKSIGGFTFYKWVIIGGATILVLAVGIWCYCKLAKIKNQSDTTTNIEMKTLFHSDMPTYMHPETQIKTPNCPLSRTENSGTRPAAVS